MERDEVVVVVVVAIVEVWCVLFRFGVSVVCVVCVAAVVVLVGL